MPELPDVESYRRYLESKALRHSVQGVEVESPGVLEDINPQGLGRLVKGRRFDSAQRHGKYLFTHLDDGKWLGMHFGMTGRLQYFKDEDTRPKHTRCLFKFDNGFDLAYVMPRKLGRIAPLNSVEDFVRERKLGPDVLSLDVKCFRALARKRSGKVKAWLMNQSVMAGLGNVYSDEVLFQTGIHPDCQVKSLGDKRLGELHRATMKVLKSAIKAEADPTRMPKSFLLPHRQAGERCPRCGGEVQSMKAAGRTAWLCPRCQKC